jgi:hypothetical protein
LKLTGESGKPGTVFKENDTLRYIQRKKGLPKKKLMASFLDPRTKDLSTMAPADSILLLAYRRNVLKDEKEQHPVRISSCPCTLTTSTMMAITMIDGAAWA